MGNDLTVGGLARREDQLVVLSSVLGLGFSTELVCSFAGQFPVNTGRKEQRQASHLSQHSFEWEVGGPR